MKKYTCKNGACIEWLDKETIRYSKDGASVSLWTDFDDGIFNRGRVLKKESLTTWDTPNMEVSMISELEKFEIIGAVSEYYGTFNVRFRVE